MDNFKVIYRILKYLEAVMDVEEPDYSRISAVQLGVSESRWEQLMYMLQSNGYVEGIIFSQLIEDTRPHICIPATPRITLKGLEYLSENGMMQKAHKVLIGLKDIIPGA